MHTSTKVHIGTTAILMEVEGRAIDVGSSICAGWQANRRTYDSDSHVLGSKTKDRYQQDLDHALENPAVAGILDWLREAVCKWLVVP